VSLRGLRLTLFNPVSGLVVVDSEAEFNLTVVDGPSDVQYSVEFADGADATPHNDSAMLRQTLSVPGEYIVTATANDTNATVHDGPLRHPRASDPPPSAPGSNLPLQLAPCHQSSLSSLTVRTQRQMKTVQKPYKSTYLTRSINRFFARKRLLERPRQKDNKRRGRSGAALWAAPARSWAEPRSQTHFDAFTALKAHLVSTNYQHFGENLNQLAPFFYMWPCREHRKLLQCNSWGLGRAAAANAF